MWAADWHAILLDQELISYRYSSCCCWGKLGQPSSKKL